MNKKRPKFQVNEEKLKMMMAGDIPMKVEPSDLTIIHEEDQAKESRISTLRMWKPVLPKTS